MAHESVAEETMEEAWTEMMEASSVAGEGSCEHVISYQFGVGPQSVGNLIVI